MPKLSGETAVITGTTSGMALATAKLFVEEGAYDFITGRRQDVLDAAVKEVGSNVTGVRGDVAKMADLESPVSTCVSTAAPRRSDSSVSNVRDGDQRMW